MKIILTLLVFIVAFYLAAMMFRRLTQTMQQLADLRRDLANSDAQLQVKLAALQNARETPERENLPGEATSTESEATSNRCDKDKPVHAPPR